jgi:DNA-binding MarR family transcriptional regulator
MDNASRTQRKKTASSRRTGLAVVADAGSGDVELGGLSRHLGYALKRAQLRVFDDFLDAVAPVKLSPAQFSVLMLLETNPGRNQTEIAATLGILRPNFVALLDALEARGLCSRTRSADDRRSHVLALTDKGHATLAEAKRLVWAKHEKKVASILTETERADLLEMLERVARLL